MLTRSNLEKRLRALEKKMEGPPKFHCIVMELGETAIEALARYISTTGKTPGPNDEILYLSTVAVDTEQARAEWTQ